MALSLRQERAIDALLAAKNITSASALCGVPKRTLATWRLENSEFAAELERRRRELTESAFIALQKHMLIAVETVSEIMQDESAPVFARLQAARTLLETGMKAYDQLDVAARLDAVERMLKNAENAQNGVERHVNKGPIL